MIATNEWMPDVVIGIDFGMTCTGVAFSIGPEWADPKPIQHWPGKTLSELANKVPTRLRYKQNSSVVDAWGFMCENEAEEASEEVKMCFKLHLDPTYLDRRDDAPKCEQARQWFVDYLHCIHTHLIETFTASVPYWNRLKTEFVFSVPTTWKDPGMVCEIEGLIGAAGFGCNGTNTSARIGLTEAEAAAVYASKQRFQKNDVILVCDAGGGTTDINLLMMTSAKDEPTQLRQLVWVEGRSIGSAFIDMAFHQLISDRLDSIQDDLQEDVEVLATKMMYGRFERIKCSYGTATTTAMPTIPLPIPGLNYGYNDSGAGIENSRFIFQREDLKSLFDTQIDRMLALLTRQLEKTQERHPGLHVDYIVLSGGLGSSPYVRQRLGSFIEMDPGLSRLNTQDIKILTAMEPQLAVVQGLVMDRIQAISSKTKIFQERCCRLSYGVRCRQPYNPENDNHLGKEVTLDTRDKKKYVENQIDWFIKQGEAVPVDGVSKPFWVKMNPGEEERPWKMQVITSNAPTEQLPTNLDSGAAKVLCSVESDLKGTGIEMKRKNARWYNNKKNEYIHAKFDVKVILGAADLKFQLQSRNKIVSKEHISIQIKWEAPSPTACKEGATLTAMFN